MSAAQAVAEPEQLPKTRVKIYANVKGEAKSRVYRDEVDDPTNLSGIVTAVCDSDPGVRFERVLILIDPKA